jgi:hypothetical protein
MYWVCDAVASRANVIFAGVSLSAFRTRTLGARVLALNVHVFLSPLSCQLDCSFQTFFARLSRNRCFDLLLERRTSFGEHRDNVRRCALFGCWRLTPRRKKQIQGSVWFFRDSFRAFAASGIRDDVIVYDVWTVHLLTSLRVLYDD